MSDPSASLCENPHFLRKERARNGAPTIFISFGEPRPMGTQAGS